MKRLAPALTALLLLTAAPVLAEAPARPASQPAAPTRIASVPPVDAPELARTGVFAVGTRVTELAYTAPDIAKVAGGTAGATAERKLALRLWYPADGEAAPAVRVTYAGTLPPAAPGGQPTPYGYAGIAAENAKPSAKGPFPLVVISHGFSGRATTMAWLGENLASKGYVVAALDHNDGTYTGPQSLIPALLFRPMDQRAVISKATSDPELKPLVDANRVGIVGYSMGGYGALNLAGAGFNPKGVPASFMPGGLLAPHTHGNPGYTAVPGLKAVAAIAPWGAQSNIGAWSSETMAGVKTPLMLLVGDQDDISGYSDGVKSIFDAAVNTDRSMLVFQNAGHTIGIMGAPAEAQGVLQQVEYFEDPVWRKERILAISQHFLTAFLDTHLKGDKAKAAYLSPAVAKSNEGVWPQAPGTPPDAAYSTGKDGVTVWPGFQRRWAKGLELHRAKP
ncbi:MAG TPA: dienelactone hydrolase family protein [Azospirillaceae bacterium]|nr:dienelactone hydrolase family protein [Azospirillaceae bacterium]